jgi:paraquat-inducible protein B
MSTPPRRTTAAIRHSRWPGWIWAVPLAAAGVVAWLLVRAFSNSGIDVTVVFDDAAGMRAKDTRVHYRGLEVGKVSDVALSGDRRQVIAHLDIDDSVEKDLNTGTHFYLEGGEPSFSDPGSLKALVSGPSIEMVPGTGTPTHRFTGSSGTPPEKLAVRVPYLVTFDGDVGNLKTGSSVTLRGFTVGVVTDVRLTTDAATGKVTTPVTLMLDPTRFHIEGPAPASKNWTTTLNGVLAKLVQQGLRATLSQTPPLIGTQQVTLEMTPGAPAASLAMDGPIPRIPAQSAGLGALLTKAGQLPLSEIGEHVRAITRHLDTLSASPELHQSIEHLDRALAETEHILHTAGPQIGPTLQSIQQTVNSLRQTADQIDATAAASRRFLGAAGGSPNGDLPDAVHEMTGAARAVRTLADYLDQHPEALIKGR